MRDTKGKKTAILVTDDPAVETAANEIAKEMGEFLQLLKTSGDATGVAFDESGTDSFAIVDLDSQDGTRSMFNTIAGLLPVIAVTRIRKPWLQSMLQHRRIGVSVTKPVSSETLRKAVSQIGDFHGRHAPHHVEGYDTPLPFL